MLLAAALRAIVPRIVAIARGHAGPKPIAAIGTKRQGSVPSLKRNGSQAAPIRLS
jgi:hypothetical protein